MLKFRRVETPQDPVAEAVHTLQVALNTDEHEIDLLATEAANVLSYLEQESGYLDGWRDGATDRFNGDELELLKDPNLDTDQLTDYNAGRVDGYRYIDQKLDDYL